MRRSTFLKSMAALAAVGAMPFSAQAAAANIKMMIPANPGGGWDLTGRTLGKAMLDSGAAATVSYDNKGGAAGVLGLAQFINGSKGDPNALMVMGADAGLDFAKASGISALFLARVGDGFRATGSGVFAG